MGAMNIEIDARTKKKLQQVMDNILIMCMDMLLEILISYIFLGNLFVKS